jgi:hypothetical protein
MTAQINLGVSVNPAHRCGRTARQYNGYHKNRNEGSRFYCFHKNLPSVTAFFSETANTTVLKCPAASAAGLGEKMKKVPILS